MGLTKAGITMPPTPITTAPKAMAQVTASTRPCHQRMAARPRKKMRKSAPNWRSCFAGGVRTTSAHCMIVILSVQLELREVTLALGHVDAIRDITLEDNDVLEHERVHLGRQ